MKHADIRGSGASWAVFVDGRQVDTTTNTYEKACIKAFKVERDLQKRERPCLCCGTRFTAASLHNRLCQECTEFAAGALV